eukprot:TRINITY_DN1659_c0_g2_i4.p1 TRINITY_DN1659_c0_g2~~TRINITY_DN1659_c0_g2_i4.p1  ORF type:complete len:351 (-),score=56.43 TRINITY_DN1659_c0_g2_i4:170-1222(-)
MAAAMAATLIPSIAQQDHEEGILDLRRKAQIARGQPTDHAGDVVIVRSAGFNLDKTIFGAVDKLLPRILIKDRLSINIYWSDNASEQISAAFAQVPRAPPMDAPLLEFMRNECNFSMEHADGHFMDHLRFCFEYSHAHFKAHSPRVMLLHSILGVGTNFFPMKTEKIPMLQELVNPEEMKQIEAFPTLLRLLLQGDLLDELEAKTKDGSQGLQNLKGISFHRVIDNAPVRLTAREFWVAMNYQVMHQLDFLPVANWTEHVDDTFLVLFKGIYDILVKTGNLEAEVSINSTLEETLPSDLARPSLSFGRFINKVTPSSVKRKLGRKAIERFSSQVGHSLHYELLWEPTSRL